jgi:hypothetical protein
MFMGVPVFAVFYTLLTSYLSYSRISGGCRSARGLQKTAAARRNVKKPPREAGGAGIKPKKQKGRKAFF